MTKELDDLKVKEDALAAAVTGLVTLTNSLKSKLDALLNNGTLTPTDQVIVKGMSDEADAALKQIADAEAADTPAEPPVVPPVVPPVEPPAIP